MQNYKTTDYRFDKQAARTRKSLFQSLKKVMKPENLNIRFERRFVLAEMPQPLTRAGEHLQFFDNHLTATRLLLRQIRDPKTKLWTRRLVQRDQVDETDLARVATAEINLSEYEYEVLSVFEGNELRYNRYFLRLETGETMLIDMFLNRELWNLILGTVEFADETTMRNFAPPAFAFREITRDKFFTAANLVDSNIDDVRQRLNEIQKII